VEIPVTSQFALLLLLTSPAAPEALDSLGHAPPSMVARLSRECVGKEYTRIMTPDSARYVVRVGRIDAQGLGKFKTRGMTSRPPDPLPWPYVVRLDAVRSQRKLGAVAGGVAGALIGWPLDYIGLGALAGGSLGGYVGSKVVREAQLYVAQPPTGARPARDSSAAGAVAAGAAATLPAAEALAPGDGKAGTTSEPEAARIRKASAEVHAKRLLRVTFTSMAQVQGHASHADQAGLHALRPTSGSIAQLPDVIPWTRILQVEKHCGSSGKGALIGGTSLGVLGALSGAATVAAGGIGGTYSGTGAEIAGGAALGALVGGAIGAGLGAAVGSAIPRWGIMY
jgi:hypothetical protein